MSLCVLEFSPIFVPRITIQAFSSNASRPHSSNHCLQARCIESSFYRVLEASQIEQYLLYGQDSRVIPVRKPLQAAPARQTSWLWMPPKSMKINENQ